MVLKGYGNIYIFGLSIRTFEIIVISVGKFFVACLVSNIQGQMILLELTFGPIFIRDLFSHRFLNETCFCVPRKQNSRFSIRSVPRKHSKKGSKLSFSTIATLS